MYIQERKVLRVVDGDTFEIKSGGKNTRVRLANVGAPLEGRPGWEKAKDKLKELIDGQKVRIKTVGESSDGWKIAQVTNSAGVFVNHQMRETLRHI